jgi:hypothetical protein
MIAIALAIGLAATLQDPVPAQDPPVVATPVEDIVVEGQRQAARARAVPYVREVLAPAMGSEVARWQAPLCAEVLNADPRVTDYMVRRLSEVGAEVGLRTDPPGCQPNVLIIMADDGPAMAREMVSTRREAFVTGASGTDRGPRQLEAFQTRPDPVRWWHLSLPVDSFTGRPTVRLPGQPAANVDVDILHPSDTRSYGRSVMGSLQGNTDRYDLQQVVIIVDVAAAAGTDLVALTDYVALVALSQIDPEAETAGYSTILNLFDPAAAPAPFLTDWDWAFLAGLYGDEVLTSRGAGTIADVMARELTRPE